MFKVERVYSALYIDELWRHLIYTFDLFYGVYRHFQQCFSYIMAVSFIGGGNRSIRRKPPTWRKSLTTCIP